MELFIPALLILPLVAGFLFLAKFEKTRYRLARETGHRLYFKSAFAGYVLSVIYAGAGFWPVMALDEHADLKGVVVLAILLGPFLATLTAKLVNLFVDENAEFQKVLDESPFELLLNEAVADEQMIMTTMDDKRVYVGFVYETSDPRVSHTQQLVLLPIISGYRDEKGKVEFTTFYTDVYQQAPAELQKVDFDRFKLVLPKERVVSLRMFDPETYVQFQGNSEAEPLQA